MDRRWEGAVDMCRHLVWRRCKKHKKVEENRRPKMSECGGMGLAHGIAVWRVTIHADFALR